MAERHTSLYILLTTFGLHLRFYCIHLNQTLFCVANMNFNSSFSEFEDGKFNGSYMEYRQRKQF
jgi:hypothetical protein